MTEKPAGADEVQGAIDRMRDRAQDIEIERVRVRSALSGVYHVAGWPGVLRVVAAELTYMAASLGHRLPVAFRGTYHDEG